MKITSPTLLLLCLPALVSAQNQQGHLRYISIGKAGTATALAAAAPSGDLSGNQLFQQLMSDAATGKATVLADQEMVMRDGQRGKVDATRQFPVPTDFRDRDASGRMIPTSFETMNYGQTLEAELTVTDDPLPGLKQRGLDLNLAPERKDLVSLHPFPMPGIPGDGMLRLPLTAVQKTATQALTWTGNSLLLSVSPSSTASLSEGEPLYCYQFIRAGLDGEKPAGPGLRPDGPILQERRLHAITFRLPRQAAAALCLKSGEDDAALYTLLSGMVSSGGATLAGHSAITCREGQRSKVESHVDFPDVTWLADNKGISMELRNIGETMEAEAEITGRRSISREHGQVRVTTIPDEVTGSRGTWNIALERQNGLELVPWQPNPSKPQETGALTEYLEQKLFVQLRIPSSGILCAGTVSTSPATESQEADPAHADGTTDITFLSQTPAPGAPPKGIQPQSHLQAFMISLPAPEGASLAARLKKAAVPLPADPLLNRMRQGELPCVAQASNISVSGQGSKTSSIRKIQQPTASALSPAVVAQPGTPEARRDYPSQDCGITLSTEFTEGESGITLNKLEWDWDTAPVLPLDEVNSPKDGIEARRCHQKIELKDLKLSRNQPLITDVRPSNARAGAPEHGRWHALVVVAR